MTTDPTLFEMRRLEQLSNTVFGIAMTLLAYDLPRGVAAGATPTWGSLADVYARPLIALALSFMIAGVFWISHHRRLQRAPYASRAVVTLNIVFLMTIVALPATNGLYGAYRHSEPVAILYFSHMTLIASLNMLLWYIALDSSVRSRPFRAALIPVVLGLAAVAIATVNPDYAPYPMLLAFAAPLMTWRREKDPPAPESPNNAIA